MRDGVGGRGGVGEVVLTLMKKRWWWWDDGSGKGGGHDVGEKQCDGEGGSGGGGGEGGRGGHGGGEMRVVVKIVGMTM